MTKNLLEVVADEPGYFELGLRQFTGPRAWVTWLIMTLQIVMFALATWCAVQFFAATETLMALKWGLPGSVLMIGALQVKLSLVPQMQADRVILAMQRAKAGGQP